MIVTLVGVGASPLPPGRLHVSPCAHPDAVLLLGHGAGGGLDGWDLSALATLLPGRGVTVARHEQPWLVAGRRVAVRPAELDRAWRPALVEVERRWPGVPLVTGGRSAGARVACRAAADPAVAAPLAVVALSFPLHPPGRPQASRAAELTGVTVPVLVVQGERDPFGTPDELRATGTTADIVVLPGARHGARPPGSAMTAGAADAFLADVVSAFIAGALCGGPGE